MMSKCEALEGSINPTTSIDPITSIDPSTPISPLRSSVRRALQLRRDRLYAVVAAAGIATVTPLAFGAAFPAVFPLASLYPDGGGDGSQGFVLTGIDDGDRAGRSVSAAGDVNGDGIDDLIIGADEAEVYPIRASSAGESYVVFGSTQGFPAIFPLESLDPAGGGDGSQGFVLTGIVEEDISGFSVSAAGDVNGDGVDDLIIGAPHGFDPPGVPGQAGRSYVVFGSTQGFPASLPLESLLPPGGGDGSRGFVLTGIQSYDAVGHSVSAAGDVNGDGIDDLIVGAPFADTGLRGFAAGESYVVFGSTEGFPPIFSLGSLLPIFGGDGSRGFVLAGIHEDDNSGYSVSGAGDVNGDSIDDLIIGAVDAAPGGKRLAGESYVVFGSTQGFPASVPLASLYPGTGGDGSRGFVLPGIGDFDHSGTSVSEAGDVNGDGIDDVIIGAYFGYRGPLPVGNSYVVFGSRQGFAPLVPLAGLFPAGGGDGSRGFALVGIDDGDNSGRSVSAAGDINGDGIDDVVIGAEDADPYGNSNAGESYVVFGSAQGFAPAIPLASLYPMDGGDGSRGFVLTGIAQDDHSGRSVSNAGDVNGDGIDDLVIGARFAEPAGESYVVFGRADAP